MLYSSRTRMYGLIGAETLVLWAILSNCGARNGFPGNQAMISNLKLSLAVVVNCLLVLIHHLIYPNN